MNSVDSMVLMFNDGPNWTQAKKALLLMDAARRGDALVASRVLEKGPGELDGANPNLIAPEGLAPIHIAAQKGRTEVVKALLAKGADPNLKVPAIQPGSALAQLYRNYNRPNSHPTGNTALHYAAANCFAEMIQLLLNHQEIETAPINNQAKTPFRMMADTISQKNRETFSKEDCLCLLLWMIYDATIDAINPIQDLTAEVSKSIENLKEEYSFPTLQEAKNYLKLPSSVRAPADTLLKQESQVPLPLELRRSIWDNLFQQLLEENQIPRLR